MVLGFGLGVRECQPTIQQDLDERASIIILHTELQTNGMLLTLKLGNSRKTQHKIRTSLNQQIRTVPTTGLPIGLGKSQTTIQKTVAQLARMIILERSSKKSGVALTLSHGNRERPNHELGAKPTPSQYSVSSFTSPEGNLTSKSSSPSSSKVASSAGKRPSKNPKFPLPAATSAFESKLERLLTRTDSPCPVASAKSAASQYLHNSTCEFPTTDHSNFVDY
jgi:hypothetical protein